MGTFSRTLDVDVCLWLRMVFYGHGMDSRLTRVFVCVAGRLFHLLFVRRGCGGAALCRRVCVCVYVCMCVCRDYQLGQSTEVTETRVCCVMPEC